MKPDGIVGTKTINDLMYNIYLKKFLPDEFIKATTQEAKNKFIEKYLQGKTTTELDIKRKLSEFVSINNKINNHASYDAILEKLILGETFTIDDAGYTYVLHPTESGYNYYKVQKKISSDGFLLLDSRKISQSDILLFDNAYQKSVSKMSNKETAIIHMGSIENNNTFKIQIGSTSNTCSIPTKAKNYEESVINEIISQINKNTEAKNIVLTRDIFIKDVSEFYSNSLFIDNSFRGFNTKRLNPQYLLDILKMKLPTKRFYLGGDLEKDISSINKSNLPVHNTDVTAITASKSFPLKYNIINEITPKLINNGIAVLDLDNPSVSLTNLKSNVVVVTGNKDKNFKNYIGQIAEQADLEDKIFVTTTCFEEGSENFNSELIKSLKLNSIIYFPTKIHPDATEKVLKKLIELLANNSENKPLKDLLEQAIYQSYESETIQFLKNEINKLRQFRIQLSFNYNKQNSETFNS